MFILAWPGSRKEKDGDEYDEGTNDNSITDSEIIVLISLPLQVIGISGNNPHDQTLPLNDPCARLLS